MKICHQSDPYLSDCIKQSVNSLKPYLRKGIPALGIPTCEPLHLDEIEIDQSSGPIYIRAIYNNVSIFGGTNFVAKSIRWVLPLYQNISFELSKKRKKCYLHFSIFISRLIIRNLFIKGKFNLSLTIKKKKINFHQDYSDSFIKNVYEIAKSSTTMKPKA